MDKRTTQEFKENSSQRMKNYWQRRREALARAAVIPTGPKVEIAPVSTEPNYKKLYAEATAKNKAYEAKIEQYESIVKSYAERTQNAENLLKKATIEYDARIKFMLDAVRHSYTAMQLAAQASTDDKGGR